jgi:DNA-binding NarL/FixJ family response regulator
MQSGPNLILCVGFNGGLGVARERALSCAGFHVSAVTAPLTAITCARQIPPQVVIIDDHDIEDWRELANCMVIAAPLVKVIVLVSTPGQPSSTVAALLSKPISPEGLVQAVQSVLKESPAKKSRTGPPGNADSLAASSQN